MDEFVKILFLITLIIIFLVLRKPLSKIKKISVQNLVIETRDEEKRD